MSMLGAFLRGAAGQGLVGVVNRMDQQDAARAERERRDRERDEDRKFRAELAELDRKAREELLRERFAASGGGGSRSSAGGGEGGGGTDYRVAALMEKYKISEGRAKQLVAAGEADQNPLTLPVGGDGVGPPQVDARTWAEVNATIAKALRDGPSMARSNYDQLTQGDINAQRREVNQGMLDGTLTMPKVAEANAAMSGKGAFGNAKTSEFTGELTALGKSEVNENNAQAGSANRANRDGVDLAKLPPAAQRELKVLEEREKAIATKINEARAADGGWNPEANPGQKQLLAEYRAIQLRRNALIDGGIGGDPLGLFPQPENPSPAPAAKPKPSQSDVRKAEPKEPGMLDRALSWLRDQHDIEGTLKRRIAEAKAGGKPLTPGEKQLAQKYGMTV